MEYQSASLAQLMTYKTLKKIITPFLLSISIVSFIFSYSKFYSFLLSLFKFYFNEVLPLKVLIHALDKGWIFLICNGILVVLANTSRMVHSPSGFDLNDLLQKKIGYGLQTTPDLKDHCLWEGQVLLLSEMKQNAVSEGKGEEDHINKGMQEKDEGREYEYLEEDGGGVGGGANSSLIVKCEKQEDQARFLAGGGEAGAEAEELQITYILGDEESENEFETNYIIVEEAVQVEEEEEEGIEKLSTEELNKKFEDFIRRMKEELRIEAQQQLIIVK